MKTFRGINTTKDFYAHELLETCGASIVIDYDEKEFHLILTDKCSAQSKFTWTDREAKLDEPKINELMRLTYAATKVCLQVIPNIPWTEDQLGSMAQAVGDRAQELTHAFEATLRGEIYNMAREQIRKAAS